MRGVRQVATFEVGGCSFGVDVGSVQEVLRTQPVTRVPLAPEAIRGLMNLRGEIVPALELRTRLGLPDRPPGDESKSVVVRTANGPMGLLVDSVADVLELDGQAETQPPGTLAGAIRDFISAVYMLDDGLLHLLDLAAVTDPAGIGGGTT